MIQIDTVQKSPFWRRVNYLRLRINKTLYMMNITLTVITMKTDRKSPEKLRFWFSAVLLKMQFSVQKLAQH